jgi:o-succinylbenzoate---CoA ligase
VSAKLHLAPGEQAPAGLADFAEQTLVGEHHLFQTSGSEGMPKWVALSHDAMRSSAAAVNAHLASTKEDVWLLALPEHHVGGYSIRVRAALSGAALVVAEGKWSASDYGRLCQKHGITHSSLVPTQVFDLVQGKHRAAASLRAIVVGGGGLSAEIGQAARELGWPVLQSYGMTEAASQVATQSLGDLALPFDPSALQLLPHWQVETDAAGHLLLSGPALASGYCIATAAGGWTWQQLAVPFATRDKVTLQHGQLSFLGREADMLKIMGELVSLRPLQEILASLSSAATLVPVEDGRRGSSLVLAHELPLAEAEKLATAYNATVRPYERCVELVALQHIPRSSLGKVLGAQVLAEVLAERGRQATQAAS